MHLGFIGLGHLGKTVADRLLECGHTLTVWNRTRSKAEGLRADVASSPRAVAEKAEIIFVCLFDSAGVHAVLGGQEGLLSDGMS